MSHMPIKIGQCEGIINIDEKEYAERGEEEEEIESFITVADKHRVIEGDRGIGSKGGESVRL